VARLFILIIQIHLILSLHKTLQLDGCVCIGSLCIMFIQTFKPINVIVHCPFGRTLIEHRLEHRLDYKYNSISLSNELSLESERIVFNSVLCIHVNIGDRRVSNGL
jgi:hypothetical protein